MGRRDEWAMGRRGERANGRTGEKAIWRFMRMVILIGQYEMKIIVKEGGQINLFK